MMIFIAKGVPYNKKEEDKIYKVWINGRIISITENQKLIWTFFYGKPKTYKDLMKYVRYLFNNGHKISKTVLTQILTQLKSLGLLAYECKENRNLCEFMLLFKNRIKPIKFETKHSEFEDKVYQFIEKCDIIALSDFIANLDNLEYTELTNGYDENYLLEVYKCKHSKSTLETVKKFIRNGECYIS